MGFLVHLTNKVFPNYLLKFGSCLYNEFLLICCTIVPMAQLLVQQQEGSSRFHIKHSSLFISNENLLSKAAIDSSSEKGALKI